MLHHILSVVLVLFFLIAGTGYNAVHYCCDSCREAGIEHVAEESCEAIHHHEHHHHDGHCHHHNSCWMKHLHVENYTQPDMLQVPAAHEIILPMPVAIAYADVELPVVVVENAAANPPPLSVGGADILRDICRWIC